MTTIRQFVVLYITVMVSSIVTASRCFKSSFVGYLRTKQSTETRRTCMTAFIPYHGQRYSPWHKSHMRHYHSHNPADIIPTEQKQSFQHTIIPGCTVSEALQTTIKLLAEQSIPEPEESALHLLSFALDLNWETGYRDLRHVMETEVSNRHTQTTTCLGRQSLTMKQITLFHSILERRCQHEPIQYIIGKWDFHMLSGLVIRKPMLCPRPETEELVELVSKDVQRLIDERSIHGKECQNANRIRILDVGAGTGAIGIALAKQYPNDVQVVALDILPAAVKLSNENAVKFLSPLVRQDVTQKIGEINDVYHAIVCSAEDFTNYPATPKQKRHYNMEFDIVVSNPPYIPSSDMETLSLDVLRYESHKALCGGKDGLDIIRGIVERLPEWMSGAASVLRHCWLEVDDSHPKIIKQWLAPGSEESIRLRVEYCESAKDFCGRDRFVKLRIL